MKNITWKVGVCYRPEADQEGILERICGSIDSVDVQNVILLGDFNFQNIDWVTGDCASSLEKRFLDCLQDNLLVQCVDSPTRGENILDLVITGDPSSVTKCKVQGNFGTSDHNIILTELSCPLPRINYAHRNIYLYSKGDYSALNEEIETLDWDSNMTFGDIEENWLFFNHQYQILRDKHVPFKFVKPALRHVPPWTRYKSVTKAKTKR